MKPYSVPVRLKGWTPTIGEHVFAVGYPQLDCTELVDSKLLKLREGLHGAYGRITSFFPEGRSSSHPTPVFEVEGDWKSGMSGGPVFNQHGDVIGVVSRSLSSADELRGVCYAACLGSILSLPQLVPSLDVSNPSWRIGYGAIRRGPWHLAGVFKTSAEAHQLAASAGESYQV
jgi:serine protease Do